MVEAVALPAKTALWLNVTKLQSFLVAMIFISSFYVKFEPALTDIFVVLAVLASIGSGLKLSPAIMPLLFFLLIYNLSGLMSYIMIVDDMLESAQYMIGLALTSLSGIFIAAYINADPVERYKHIQRAYWIGATIGALLGLISYFKVAGFDAILPNFAGRALGGYKDPNVYSTWLVFPAITMMQAFMLGTLRIRFLSVASFILIFGALFLAFSRGAWINALMAAGITVAFTFVLSPSQPQRFRILTVAILASVFFAIVFAILLSIPETQAMFADRFTAVKSYDAGETGRFGNQLNAVPMLIELPFGFGPYQFGMHFTQAPHNTFLNSFSSAGWLGGMMYFTLIVVDIVVSFRTMFIRTPFQPYAITVFGCLLAVVLQGIQIDTEHWRHLYWMTGIAWGFFAASLTIRNGFKTNAAIASTWNIPRFRPPQT